MDKDKKPEDTNTSLEAPAEGQSTTSLEQPSQDGDQTTAPNTPTPGSTPAGDAKPPKQPNKFKLIFRKLNLYFLLFLLVVVIVGAISIVSFLNSKKTPNGPSIATQQLTANALKQLANSDATVGDTGQTLTVQGNAIFSGQVLVRSNLNVAGTIQLGGDLTAQNLTASGTANLANTQIQGLQVANGATFKGVITAQNDLNVAGTAAFSGTVTAGQIIATKLILSGNAVLEVPNHLAFTGASPGRSIDASVLGSAGSASVNGSDTTGTVNVNSGSNPKAGCFVTMTFNRAFANTPHVLVSPIGNAAGETGYYVNRSTTSMSICFSNAPPARSVFAFDYFITD